MQKSLQLVAIMTIALTGMVHLIIAPQHFSHAPAHGLFFGALGLAQLIWAGLFWREPNRPLYDIGMSLSGGIILLWLLTELAVAPFSDHAHPVDWSLIVTKLSETVALLSLMGLTMPTKKVLAEGLALAVIASLALWGSGLALQQVAPQLGQGSAPHEHNAAETAPHEHNTAETTPGPETSSEHAHTEDTPHLHATTSITATPHAHTEDTKARRIFMLQLPLRPRHMPIPKARRIFMLQLPLRPRRMSMLQPQLRLRRMFMLQPQLRLRRMFMLQPQLRLRRMFITRPRLMRQLMGILMMITLTTIMMMMPTTIMMMTLTIIMMMTVVMMGMTIARQRLFQHPCPQEKANLLGIYPQGFRAHKFPPITP